MGIIHCDIKPENILLSSSEYEDEYPIAKICDFGLCHIIDQNVGKSFMEVKCGTNGYFAPEQKEVFLDKFITFQKNWIGPEVDVWALGIVLYELAVAYKPNKI